MRISIFVLGIFVAAVAAGPRAEAQNYPWCQQYRSSQICAFVSFAQCMDTVRGKGGFCIRNNTYQPRPRAASVR